MPVCGTVPEEMKHEIQRRDVPTGHLRAIRGINLWEAKHVENFLTICFQGEEAVISQCIPSEVNARSHGER